jgi:hypothetical protein
MSQENKSPAQTQMVADQKKKVRIRALQLINMQTPTNEKGIIIPEGKEAEVDEDLAEMLCKPIEGNFNFAGELVSTQATRHKHIRAVRV